ncbi:hypothetical protein J4U02_gp114 [Mycobacterium phage Aziz]|uniref:Uncharacterized protein n=1 Tax=Mycobacterium phage Aziz TaxID=2762281 RepID=A0A7G8LHS6_9CAUD|nr:hypothetical protein J4U02_gp114 [Mycobacterium phage Aziz]QNJ56798.1 hypothetical protein SEA_AZIZ_160 [Mycobacterium phage Aziz]
MQFKDTAVVEGVGTVTVSTKHFGGAGGRDYWETAILWPESWPGSLHTDMGDGFEVAACHYGLEAGREAAVLAHRRYMQPRKLTELAATIVHRPEEVYA